jgi:hypothetical protein
VSSRPVGIGCRRRRHWRGDGERTGRDGLHPDPIEVAVDQLDVLAQEVGDGQHVPQLKGDTEFGQMVMAGACSLGDLVCIARMGDGEHEVADAAILPVAGAVGRELPNPGQQVAAPDVAPALAADDDGGAMGCIEAFDIGAELLLPTLALQRVAPGVRETMPQDIPAQLLELHAPDRGKRKRVLAVQGRMGKLLLRRVASGGQGIAGPAAGFAWLWHECVRIEQFSARDVGEATADRAPGHTMHRGL